MRVIKRDGSFEDVSFDKVLRRIQVQCKDLGGVDPHGIAQRVCARIYDGVKTTELDELAAQMCASLVTEHPDYGVIASRLIVSNHQKNTSPSFSETMSVLYHSKDNHGDHTPRISDEVWSVVQSNKEKLNSVIDYERDYNFDYFGFKTLERSYLIKVDGRVIERPQHMWMRVALGIHGSDMKDAIETYQLMSTRHFTHATPTLFNAGTPRPQLSSCFVKGTMVYTDHGSKPIEAIKLGDQVLTHTGRFMPVTQLHVNNLVNRYLLDFKAYGTPEITATNNHGFMSLTTEQIKWGNACPQWNELEKLRVGDYIEVPHYEGEYVNVTVDVFDCLKGVRGNGRNISYNYTLEDNTITCKPTYTAANTDGRVFNHKHDTINRFWHVTEDFCKFIGIWYKTGSIINRYGEYACFAVPKGISFNIPIQTDTLEFVQTSGEHILGVQPITTYFNNGTCTVCFYSVQIGYIFDAFFKSTLHPLFHQLSPSHITSLVAGLVATKTQEVNKNNVVICMHQQQLMKDIFFLLRSRGTIASYSESFTLNNDFNHETTYNISVGQNIIDNNVLRINGRTFVRIERKMRSIKNDTVVYNIGVKEDHSYVVEGLVAKNCFLLAMEDDSIKGIFNTLNDIAEISKHAGGIGLHIHQIRATGSHIRGTNGESTGIIPMLRVFNATGRYVNQGGKRNGSIAVYLEPSHPDFEKFLDIRKNHGNIEERCLDLFTAAWLPDLFMKRVEMNELWSFFCPDECPGLADVYGEEYELLYTKYEKDGKARRTIKAQQLFMSIIKSQIETGTPYILYKDAANQKSNQKNLGTIKSSNLCSEILEFSSPEETAVCNLASIALPSFIEYDENDVATFNFTKLHDVTGVITKNLCKVIDKNFYPTEKCKRSNMRHRPIGIGVQGLADTYAIMRVAFDSPVAAELNKRIFETIYHGALTASMNISKRRSELRDEMERNATSDERKAEIRKHLNLTKEEEQLTSFRGAYVSFKGSPAQQGLLQFDLWGQSPSGFMWDWDTLKQDIKTYGLRNSLLLAPMPTASTSQILGFNECFEPFTSNIYQRRTLAGEFTIINKYLIRDLLEIGLWNVDMKNRILLGNGSIQHIQEIPEQIRTLYKTSWELKQRVLIDQAADRGIYICQTQSLNLFMEDPDFNKLSNMHFYSWKKGLKTGIYYLRTRPKAKTIAFSIDVNTTVRHNAGDTTEKTHKPHEDDVFVCTRDDPACTMCSA